MKFLRRISLWIFVVICFLMVGMNFYIRTYGRKIVEKIFEETLQRDFKIEDIQYRFPFGVVLTDVEFKDFLKAKHMLVFLHPMSFWGTKMHFASVVFIEPEINIQRIKNDLQTENKEQKNDQLAISVGQKQTAKELKVWNSPRKIQIDRLILRQGRIHYLQDILSFAADLTGEKPSFFSVVLQDVFLEIKRFRFPLESEPILFQLTGRVAECPLWPILDSRLESSGWLNWARKDMDGYFKLYGPDKKVSLQATAQSNNNQMKVEGNFDLNAPLPVMNGKRFGLALGANFFFDTPMDDFQIREVSFSGNVKAAESP